MREFRDMEAVVRVWVQYLEAGSDAFSTPKATRIDPNRGDVKRAPSSTPSNFRCDLLQLGCMLHQLGKTKGEVLVKRCTRPARSKEASFDAISSEYFGMSKEACKSLYREAVTMFYGLILINEFPDSPFEREAIAS